MDETTDRDDAADPRDMARLLRTRDDYLAAEHIYRAWAARLSKFERLLEDERAARAKPALQIVYGTCIGYIRAGADALEAAVQRMTEALGEPQSPPPDELPSPASSADEPSAASPAADKPLDLTEAAQELTAAASAIQGLAYLLNVEAAELHDRTLTGDPHPYGDVLYGICVPYLAMAAEALS